MEELVKGGTIELEGQSFRNLESLFLHIAGQQNKQLDWL